MKRIKLRDRVLPTYTKGEEIFNMVSHIVGGAFGIAVITLCIIFAAIHKNGYGVISGIIYGITMVLLYTMSSIYHGLKPNTTSKKVFQIIDHCTIFLLIAGSYTPFALCTFRKYNSALGWTLFGIIWGVAILGVVLNSIDLKRYKAFSIICYLAMGWCILLKAPLLPKLLTMPGFILLAVGRIILYYWCYILWTRKKIQIYALSVSFIDCSRKSIAVFMYYYFCNVTQQSYNSRSIYKLIEWREKVYIVFMSNYGWGPTSL